jgi:hypothetical protein
VNDTEPQPGRSKRDPNRRVVMCHCMVHGGPRDFTNLVLTKRDSEIEMNPYATGRCIIVLDQNAATKLFDVLGEWLG